MFQLSKYVYMYVYTREYLYKYANMYMSYDKFFKPIESESRRGRSGVSEVTDGSYRTYNVYPAKVASAVFAKV